MSEEVASIKVADIRARHPFPWRDEALGGGLMRLVDANGNEVALHMILAHCVITTAVMARAA